MVVLIFLVIVVLIGFSEIGIMALLVLPLTAAFMTAIVSFFAMFGGVEGSAEVFFISAAVTVGGFGLISLMTRT